MILYVFAIQQRNAPPETYLPAFHAATKCQLQITSIAISGSLAHRYGVVLQELRAELLRHNAHLFALTAEQDDGTGTGLDMQGGHLNLERFGNTGLVDLQAGHMGLDSASGNVGGQLSIGQDDGLGFADGSPGSSIIQMTGWGQFDSLVRSPIFAPAFPWREKLADLLNHRLPEVWAIYSQFLVSESWKAGILVSARKYTTLFSMLSVSDRRVVNSNKILGLVLVELKGFTGWTNGAC